jgi:hypothetical protein
MESGWQTKDLHHLILASSVYQTTSSAIGAFNEVSEVNEVNEVNEANEVNDKTARLAPAVAKPASIDPQNRLLRTFRVRRLEAEQVRDAILAVARRLDDSLGGKTIPLRNRQFVFDHTSIDHTKYDSLRRAAYLPVVRNNLYTLFEQFDFPDPTMPCGSRNATVVAPQALVLMNSDLVMDSADQFATLLLERAADDAERVGLAYERALGRPPHEHELQRALTFVREITAGALTGAASFDPPAEQRAWALFCQSLFACNEFIYLR